MYESDTCLCLVDCLLLTTVTWINCNCFILWKAFNISFFLTPPVKALKMKQLHIQRLNWYNMSLLPYKYLQTGSYTVICENKAGLVVHKVTITKHEEKEKEEKQIIYVNHQKSSQTNHPKSAKIKLRKSGFQFL